MASEGNISVSSVGTLPALRVQSMLRVDLILLKDVKVFRTDWAFCLLARAAQLV